MKKCPYCAELIQDEAIVCRYCGRDLQKESVPSPTSSREASRLIDREPGIGVSLLLGLLLLVAVYGVGMIIVLFWTGSPGQLQSTIVLYQLAVMMAIGLLANRGLDLRKTSFFRWLALVILGMVPVLGWIVLYWAGRGIARFPTRYAWLTGILVFDVVVFVVGYQTISTFLSIPESASAPATGTPNYAGSIEAETTQTLAALAAQYVPPTLAIPLCYSWEKVDGLPSGRDVCVFGKLAYQKQIVSSDWTGSWNLIRFSDDPSTFYITSQGDFNVKSGDCIRAVAPLDYDSNGVPFIKVEKLYKWPTCN